MILDLNVDGRSGATMSDSLKKAIEDMQGILATKMEDVAKLKRTINGMAAAIGEAAIYPDEEPEQPSNRGRSATVRPDEFFGKSPITAAREYLEKVAEPKNLEEIFDGLVRGGFDFDAQGWKDEKHRPRFLAISLGKNTAIFTRLPSGPFGLTKWYPELKRAKVRAADAASEKEQPEEAEPKAPTEAPLGTGS
jgi:hypothetical protein